MSREPNRAMRALHADDLSLIDVRDGSAPLCVPSVRIYGSPMLGELWVS